MPHPGVKNRPSAEELRAMYVEQKLSMPAIAEQLGVSSTSVGRWMVNAGIERRPIGWERGRARKPEDRSQKAEGRSQKAEGRGRKAEKRPFLRLSEIEQGIVLRNVDAYFLWVEERKARGAGR